MSCKRCGSDAVTKRGKFCADCEREYDTWVRQHATDIVWLVLAGGVVLGTAGVALPLLGVETVAAICGAFLGWGTILVGGQINARRRRKQFLRGADLPRAYLPAPK